MGTLSSSGGNLSSSSSRRVPSSPDRNLADGRIQKVRARIKYSAQLEGELSFDQGEIFVLLEEYDENWWRGEIRGEIGFFPPSHVEKMRNVGA